LEQPPEQGQGQGQRGRHTNPIVPAQQSAEQPLRPTLLLLLLTTTQEVGNDDVIVISMPLKAEIDYQHSEGGNERERERERPRREPEGGTGAICDLNTSTNRSIEGWIFSLSSAVNRPHVTNTRPIEIIFKRI